MDILLKITRWSPGMTNNLIHTTDLFHKIFWKVIKRIETNLKRFKVMCITAKKPKSFTVNNAGYWIREYFNCEFNKFNRN